MNRLPGHIAAIDRHGSIALVDAVAADQCFTAMLIGTGNETASWQAGMPVTLLFKEAEVSLAKDLAGQISMRNRLACRVTAIEQGRLMSKVVLDFRGHEVISLITTRSAQALAIVPGDAVEALIKANEMTLVPEPQA
ncbi:TOBE domain-containing protein [Noviherbaspirillum saxi]|uniref:Tobe domain protein n=1 Tax=Noviherbaspirillum saxi TaxID=2320863 RepID=A0A3A3G150_9BURK|nr:TOBE domain-containing protein [Noviherbaspirillum saxi]RJF95166.1 tobe domain protein [Noviherbaspirillum saxi]